MPEPPLRHCIPSLASALVLAPLCLIAGCRHKPAPAPPPAAVAPPVTSSTITVITPLPSLPPGKAPSVQQAPAPQPAPPPVEEKVHHPRRLRRKATPPKTDVSAATPAAPTNPASEAPAAGEAATGAPGLGELSAGTAISSQQRTRMLDDISKQEARLAKLPGSASSDATAMQTQIRTFLARARLAVAQNDLDGAETLNTKARVLLDELQGE